MIAGMQPQPFDLAGHLVAHTCEEHHDEQPK